jgi:hypothetical protein
MKHLYLPLFILIAVAAAVGLQPSLPLTVQEGFYACSMLLRVLLLFMLPWIIFSSIYRAFSALRGMAVFFLVALFGCVILSNSFSVAIAGFFSLIITPHSSLPINNFSLTPLTPSMSISFPPLVSNITALMLACLGSLLPIPWLHKQLDHINYVLYRYCYFFLHRIFIPTLPLFIFGFFIKLTHDGIFAKIFGSNMSIFLWIGGIVFGYLFLLFLGAGFLYQRSWGSIARNILPPAITSFSSMSGAAALPFSLEAARQNTRNPALSDLVMPITMNIHMIGDAIIIPMMAFFLLPAFGIPPPSLWAFSVFLFAFVITKFSGASVPGGSMLVMIPVLESTLGFNAEMTTLMTILYILMDPFATSANVIGNSLFILYFNRLMIKLRTQPSLEKPV